MEIELLEKIKSTVEEIYEGNIERFLSALESELKSVASNFKKVEIRPEDAIVSISNVTKVYNLKSENVHALKGVDLLIGKGEIVSIVGPSGSGKSTLLQLIGGLDHPSSGEVVVNNQNLNILKEKELSLFRNETVGFVFQLFYLQPYLSVLENVMLPLIIKGVDRNASIKRAEELVEAVGLGMRANHLPKQLSGGQMQRVAIARALANNPAILLADEPTANLDRETAGEILELINKIREEFNTTVIIVTHDVNVANKSDRIIKISDGKIL